MSKRRLEREIDALREKVLCDMSAKDRVQARLQQAAAGQETQAAQLDETAPREDHSMCDPEYVAEWIATMRLRQIAVYQLHRWLLEFKYRYTYHVLETLLEEEGPPSADRRAGAGLALCRLTEITRAYADYAEEELNVSLETFLAGHDTGQWVLERVNATLLNYRELCETALPEYLEIRAAADGNDPPEENSASPS